LRVNEIMEELMEMAIEKDKTESEKLINILTFPFEHVQGRQEYWNVAKYFIS